MRKAATAERETLKQTWRLTQSQLIQQPNSSPQQHNLDFNTHTSTIIYAFLSYQYCMELPVCSKLENNSNDSLNI